MTSSLQNLVAIPLADLEHLVARASQRWLSVADAAGYAGLSDDSIRRLISGGRLTAHRPCKGKVLIDRLQLDAYVSSCTSTPRTGRGRGRRA